LRLIIKKRAIDAPIDIILKKVQSETKYLKDIQTKKEDVICTCPFHKNGQENHPACFVLNSKDSDMEYGTFHCFACGESGSLSKLIGKCYGENSEFGKNWLIENFGSTFIEYTEYLPKIEPNKKEYLDESVLNSFEYDNEDALNYLINKRHLNKEILKEFKVGFEKESNSVTFPCWDVHNNLVGIFRRNIYTKFFTIPQIDPKPIYLLNFIIKNGISSVVVCESQINALTLWGWGIPAIALFGTGSSAQYDILKKSGIRKYFLAFDGDLAGEIGANKFSNYIGKDVLVNKIVLPKGKDVNDLTMEEFKALPIMHKDFI
jgi:DNA primase